MIGRKKPKIAIKSKITTEYRVPILVAGGKVAAPHLLMPDKGEWNNS